MGRLSLPFSLREKWMRGDTPQKRRYREQERCPDCAKWSQRYTDAIGAAIADLKRKGQNGVRCPAHPTLVWHDAETPTTPEDTLREAGISTKRQAHTISGGCRACWRGGSDK